MMKISDNYHEYVFRNQVSDCLEQTRKILRNEKQLTTLDNVAHKYADKYLVADYLARAAIVCYLNCFSTLGLSAEDLSKLVSWSECLDVTLRFEVDQKCVFVKEAKRDIENPTRHQTEVIGLVGFALKTSKIITTVIDYYYSFTAQYKLVAYRGVGDTANDRIVLQSRSSEQEIVILSKTSPYAGATNEHFDLNISWLLRRMDPKSSLVNFSIDRDRDDCHTPSRNTDVSDALSFFSKSMNWCQQVANHLTDELFQVQLTYSQDHVKQDLESILKRDVFNPVYPLVSNDVQSPSIPTSGLKIESESKPAGNEKLTTSSDANLICTESTEEIVHAVAVTSYDPPTVLTDELVNQLLSEQVRSIQAKFTTMATLFPPSIPTPSTAGSRAVKLPIISIAEAKLVVTFFHMESVAQHFHWGIQFIENMIRDQLVAAVGKTLQASDFTAYMRYHNRKLFKEEFQPRPFSHAVRRTAQHSPEGSIRIEEQARDSTSEPIYTACCSRSASNAATMQFALNASTNVTFGGDRHLHTWLNHSFSGQELPRLKLVAQARQFSCFIVLVGRIVSAHVFEPKYGMIVQNKDEITIPLDLEQIPTPKQFRDAIESLSPEQQRFAKAFRGMQLESTLFGVLVLQIKPQLEMVLKLSTDILTKEIKLTQDLMEMFIKYQIPSDLLSYDETSLGDASPMTRLNAVKEHITNMRSMIMSSKQHEIEDQQLRRSYNRAEVMAEERESVMCQKSMPMKKMSRRGGSDDMARREPGYAPASAPCMSSLSVAGAVMPDMACGSAQQRDSSPPANAKEKSAQLEVPQGNKVTHNQSDIDIVISSPLNIVDYTKFPSLLDARYEELDSDSVLRPTIINPGQVWEKKSFKSLMSGPETKNLGTDDQSTEKCAAFDLLDALTKSGALVMHSASLHVVIAATHCFDKSLMDTVVQGNVNPIERVERSALIMASTIHEMSAADLISENERSRVLTYSPQLNEQICG